MNDERNKSDFAGWLRNLPRKSWSLCIPYKFNGEWKALYPDLIIFSKAGKKIKVDLLDPHDSALADSVAKAKGLIQYANRHGQDFDRIQFIIKDASGHLRRLDLKDKKIQAKVNALKDTEPGELTKIFEELG